MFQKQTNKKLFIKKTENKNEKNKIQTQKMTLFFWWVSGEFHITVQRVNSKDYQQILRKRSSCRDLFPFILFSLNSAILRTTLELILN